MYALFIENRIFGENVVRHQYCEASLCFNAFVLCRLLYLPLGATYQSNNRFSSRHCCCCLSRQQIIIDAVRIHLLSVTVWEL